MGNTRTICDGSEYDRHSFKDDHAPWPRGPKEVGEEQTCDKCAATIIGERLYSAIARLPKVEFETTKVESLLPVDPIELLATAIGGTLPFTVNSVVPAREDDYRQWPQLVGWFKGGSLIQIAIWTEVRLTWLTKR